MDRKNPVEQRLELDVCSGCVDHERPRAVLLADGVPAAIFDDWRALFRLSVGAQFTATHMAQCEGVTAPAFLAYASAFADQLGAALRDMRRL